MLLCRVKAIEQNAIESALARAKETEEKTRELEKRALEAVAAKSREVRGWLAWICHSTAYDACGINRPF